MSFQSVLTIVIALGIVALLMSRQLRWRPVDSNRALRLPVILGGIGLLLLAQSGITHLSVVDTTFLLVELLLSAAIGAVMGLLTRFRYTTESPRVLEARAGGWGASLWLVLIAVRVLLDLWATSLGGHLITQTGVILVLLGLSRATAALVVRGRMPQVTAAA